MMTLTAGGLRAFYHGESADEAPSQFGATDFVATDVTAGSEDTVFDVSLRTAGAALGARYRFQSTGAFLYTITGAPTAARTITLPDKDVSVDTAPAAATQAEMEAATSTTVYASPGRIQYHPGVAKGWSLHDNAGADTASYNVTSITDAGVGDHTVNWGTDFSSANHCDVVSASSSTALPRLGAGPAAGTSRILGFAADTPFGAEDLSVWAIASYGDQA